MKRLFPFLFFLVAATPASSKNIEGMLVSAAADAIGKHLAPAAPVRTFASGSTFALCFVPDGPSCERMLVRRIEATRDFLLIQAYSFTDPDIAEAVVKAHRRGVKVVAIVDKSQVTDKYSSATFLKNAGIPVVVDQRPAIAHNKVMIFDGAAVFTGSYNFTRSAETRNAENGLIVEGDPAFIRAFTDNWNARYRQSTNF